MISGESMCCYHSSILKRRNSLHNNKRAALDTIEYNHSENHTPQQKHSPSNTMAFKKSIYFTDVQAAVHAVCRSVPWS